MGPIVAAIASSLISKMLGGNQQQPQAPIFQFGGRQRIPMNPVPTITDPRGSFGGYGHLTDNPILAAFAGGDAPADAPNDPKKEKQGFGTNVRDAFLQSLTQGFVQQLFGGQRSNQTYQAPTFR